MQCANLLFSLPLAMAVFAVTATAQQQEPNPAQTPDVFLDNHRPLIQKKEKNPTSRTVTGQVVDDTGQPLEGALVTLTDEKTKEKRTFFTKKGGRYQFEDLAFTNDYSVQARWKTFLSGERKLSQYDHTVKIVRILQVATPEGPQAAAPAAEAKKDDPAPKN